ncbi:cytochrome c [Enterovibrio sp. ZSDZ35]|uniref:Cytochrome c n=1 Tax=Enterovibrio qingdaonensis TaxID=2899818 RepID=A0ABT5QGZ2_9GAMM|nr:cytochrome c [Enterovibrio sp. ZSDZ35]MDD1780233.1 cytochrome c [Enterovibrio sp. ZSDZ35]
MLNKLKTLSFFALVLSTGTAIAAPKGDAELGQQKAYTCQFCHGATGYTNVDAYPHINGQNAVYLYNAMLAYKNGERTNALGLMMKQQMTVLSEQDMADIAAFYASQPAGKPE